MKKYIGTKQVEAEPMTMGEAYEKGLLQAGRVPDEEYAKHMGYHVKYSDGYESWSPAGPFEQAYRIAEAPLNRMLIEGEELTDKASRLYDFIDTKYFDELDEHTQAMLYAQFRVMKDYQDLLNKRYTKMESGKGNFSSFSFGIAIEMLKRGYAIRRSGWNGKGLFVIKQIPAHIESDVIPKMQSLPQSAKNLILQKNGFIEYTSQCLIYNEGTGRADSWVPSISDIFAEDWEIVSSTGNGTNNIKD